MNKRIVTVLFVGLMATLFLPSLAKAEVETPRLISSILSSKSYSTEQNVLRLGTQYGMCTTYRSQLKTLMETEDRAKAAPMITLLSSTLVKLSKYIFGDQNQYTKVKPYCELLDKEYRIFFKHFDKSTDVFM